jgi:hypothetical protein
MVMQAVGVKQADEVPVQQDVRATAPIDIDHGANLNAMLRAISIVKGAMLQSFALHFTMLEGSPIAVYTLYIGAMTEAVMEEALKSLASNSEVIHAGNSTSH